MPHDATHLESVDPDGSLIHGTQIHGSRSRRLRFWIALAIFTIALSLMQWGSNLLISDDPLPAHVDEAVVLQGSILGEKARIRGAMRLLKQNIADRMLVSIPKESYWGQAVSPVAYAYIEKQYGHEFANRTDFCETGPEVNSTEQEARALIGCIRTNGLNSVAVVTSSYHTRRAGILWRRILRQEHTPVNLWIHGVADPEFHAEGWWRERLSAKTWSAELTKLLWTLTSG